MFSLSEGPVKLGDSDRCDTTHWYMSKRRKEYTVIVTLVTYNSLMIILNGFSIWAVVHLIQFGLKGESEDEKTKKKKVHSRLPSKVRRLAAK